MSIFKIIRASALLVAALAAQQVYQPLGDLLLSLDGIQNAGAYRRDLDLETGVVKVRYEFGRAALTRETFISYPDRVLVVGERRMQLFQSWGHRRGGHPG